MATDKEKVAEMIAKARARLAAISAEREAAKQQVADNLARSMVKLTTEESTALSKWNIDDSRPWNEQQMAAILTGMQGKSFCLIGAAGTGKTSTLKGLVTSLIRNNIVPPLETNTKWLRMGKPGIVLVSFTNMAVRQIAKHFSSDVTCVTIHKLVEQGPTFYEVTDPATGKTVTKVRFEPQRNKFNPLPRNLKTVIVDESSMVSTEHIGWIIDAMRQAPSVQWIFLGDLNQIPPVFGQAILGKKLMELPIVELTQVYRQALESPIISLAHQIKDGIGFPLTENHEIDKGEHGKLVIRTWSKPVSAEDACNKAANFCKAAINEGILDPFKDMILCPFGAMVGKRGDELFSSGQLNIRIADWLGRERNATVYEVIAGFEQHYLAIGDKVLVDKREAVIVNIQWNRQYSGKRPIDPKHWVIDRWGGSKKRTQATDPNIIDVTPKYEDDEVVKALDVEELLANMMHTTVEDRVHQASHSVKVRFINGQDPATWKASDEEDPDMEELCETKTLDTANEINNMLFGYACTVHKSQGSEWRKVFFFVHQSHNVKLSREITYTAITRAREELYVICEPDRGLKVGSLTKAAKSPIIKGNTLPEKLEFLKKKYEQEALEAQQKETEDEA